MGATTHSHGSCTYSKSIHNDDISIGSLPAITDLTLRISDEHEYFVADHPRPLSIKHLQLRCM